MNLLPISLETIQELKGYALRSVEALERIAEALEKQDESQDRGVNASL